MNHPHFIRWFHMEFKDFWNNCNVLQISLSDVAYVGNDINDLEVMRWVETTFCPADDHVMIKEFSQCILLSKGGEGVSRDILDLLT